MNVNFLVVVCSYWFSWYTFHARMTFDAQNGKNKYNYTGFIMASLGIRGIVICRNISTFGGDIIANKKFA